jgi:polysaccharide deacetylase family protein (PEP-CTERM system associated)
VTKVLHVLSNLELAGAQKSVTEICVGLRTLGYEVHVAFSAQGGQSPGADEVLVRRLLEADVRLHPLRCLRRRINIAADLAAFAELWSVLRRERPDIVHTHMTKAGVLGQLAAQTGRHSASVHSVRGWSFYGARTRLLRRAYVAVERLAARRTAALLAVSRSTLADGIARGIGAPERYRLVRSGIDFDSWQAARGDPALVRAELRVPAHCKLVGTVGVLSEAKAPQDFVEVARRVAAERPDVCFVMVGYGSLKAEVEAQISAAGLSERFRLLGLRQDVPRLLASFDCFVLTSHWEGFPRVVLEAGSLEIPVVTTEVGEVVDFVRELDGRTARVGDLEQLSKHVLDALEGRFRARPVAASTMAEFSLSSVLRQHVDVYESLRDSSTPNPTPPPPRVAHRMSIDLEDWELDVERTTARERDASCAMERRVAALLRILDGTRTRCTFFALGATARRYRALVRDLASAGHELACHGDQHRRPSSMTKRGFEEDISRATDAIGEITGVQPLGYRAPYLSLRRSDRWVYDVLAANGYRYSSSVFAVEWADKLVASANTQGVREIPVSTLRLGAFRVRAGGGGSWRLLPSAMIVHAVRQAEESGRPFAAYLHPHEFDSNALLPASKARFAYVNLGRRTIPGKLRDVLCEFEFGPYGRELT